MLFLVQLPVELTRPPKTISTFMNVCLPPSTMCSPEIYKFTAISRRFTDFSFGASIFSTATCKIKLPLRSPTANRSHQQPQQPNNNQLQSQPQLQTIDNNHNRQTLITDKNSRRASHLPCLSSKSQAPRRAMMSTASRMRSWRR